jgi:hypothetical protein
MQAGVSYLLTIGSVLLGILPAEEAAVQAGIRL